MSESTAIRAATLTYIDDPFLVGVERAMKYEPDAVIVMADGKITQHGPADSILPALSAGVRVEHYHNCLVLPGFIDAHVHYPQTQIIASFGHKLLDWLNHYTFPAEQSFADPAHARRIAEFYLRENLRNGITTAMVYGTVHPHSVDVFFEESEKLQMRNIAGKVMMDRHAPVDLLDTPASSYEQTRQLLQKWHGRARNLYAITPRFAPTSSPEQLEAAGALRREFPDAYVQTHLAENLDEIRWVKDLFPARTDYVDVYDHFGLLGRRTVLGHGVHLSERELARLHETHTAIAHCSTSNLFLGSGLFDLRRSRDPKRPVGIAVGTDIGGGTSFSILQTLNETYKIAHLNHYPLSAGHAFYLATRGSAEALDLQDRIGSIAPGLEADLVVLDLHSTPLIRFRMQYARDLAEMLFIQMILGDDRAIRATYVAGQLRHDRPPLQE